MKISLGWLLVAASFAPWAIYTSLPFMALSRHTAAVLATGAFVTGQILFIAGLALLGKNAFARIRSRIRCTRRVKQQ